MEPNSYLVDLFTTIFIAIFVGFLVLWLWGRLAAILEPMLMKALPIIALTVLVGWVAIKAIKNIFGG
jgi:hypothetical protein